ncbi:MAG TPA: glycosyltransferase family 1 protein [Gammaproteobacteria bacterium]|nr:glycosyltransferase family 1 protein [Gammaproteobacteria bacterium]
MHVGLEVTAALAQRFTGVPRYSVELANAFASLEGADLRCRMLFRFADYRKRGLMPTYPWPARWYGSGPWPAMPRCDVVHGLATRLPRRCGRAARVITIHDLSPFMLPNYGSERSLRNTQRRYREAAEADRIIAVSQATKDDYVRIFDTPPESIDVVHHGLGAAFLEAAAAGPAPHAAKPPYLLAFGGTPRKNLARTLRAFALSRARKSFVLRVLGPPDPAAASMLDALALRDAVRFEADADDAHMVALYRGCSGLLFASLQEGFGLPLLEAMACSTPVLTSDRPGTAEIAGGHARLVDPESVESIAAGIDALATVDSAALAAAAAYASTFTWRRAAERTLAVYRRVTN